MMTDEQGIQSQAGKGEPGGDGPALGGDVRGEEDDLQPITNLVVLKNVAYLVLSWVDWDEEGFYAIGHVA